MALHTLGRCSPKYALQVASFTRDLRVAATEREAGAAVIDFNVGTTGTILGRGIDRQHEAKAQGQRD
jgi:methenyltetrahydromethanopterin cyclohydrolase